MKIKVPFLMLAVMVVLFGAEKSFPKTNGELLGVPVLPTDSEVRKMQKQSCKGYWHGPNGGSCHKCPVGKVMNDGVCACPEGFDDLGPHRSCACPKGMAIHFDKKGAHCVGTEPGQYVLLKKEVQDSGDIKTVDDETKTCGVDPVCYAKQAKNKKKYALPKIKAAF